MQDESHLPVSQQSLVFRLRKRAEIRRQIPGRKSVEEGARDRIADLLEEAAHEIERLQFQNVNLATKRLIIEKEDKPVLPWTPLLPNTIPIRPDEIVSKCSKCGMDIYRVMSYTCSHMDCPTGMGPVMC